VILRSEKKNGLISLREKTPEAILYELYTRLICVMVRSILDSEYMHTIPTHPLAENQNLNK
jgi:hypothetical protein